MGGTTYNDAAFLTDLKTYFCAVNKGEMPLVSKDLTKAVTDLTAQTPTNTCPDGYGYETPSDANERAKRARNNMAFGVAAEIQTQYEQFKSLLFVKKGLSDATFDFLTLGTTAASVIAPSVRTKTIFSALASGFTGLNFSVSNDFFSKQTYSVVALAMETRHQAIYDEIVRHLTDDDVTKYPWTAALRDLSVFYGSGSLSSGLEELQREAGAAGQKQQQLTATADKVTIDASSFPKSLACDKTPQTITLKGPYLTAASVIPLDRLRADVVADSVKPAADGKSVTFDLIVQDAKVTEAILFITTSYPGVAPTPIRLPITCKK